MDDSKREITKIAREVGKFTVRTLRKDGIGSSEFDVLHVIRKNPGIKQSAICEVTGLDKGSVARITANLEQKGYVERKPDPKDRRSRELYATDSADGLKNSKAKIEAEFYEWLLESFSEDEKREFCRMLEIIYEKCKSESKAGFPEMTKIIEDSD
ncbi:MAG: MarR family winged helix-turn-helix transcriptional regulator [Oscillospiraceae bacterium]|jgi:DNA-binding MarR family transcriptional regulator